MKFRYGTFAVWEITVVACLKCIYCTVDELIGRILDIGQTYWMHTHQTHFRTVRLTVSVVNMSVKLWHCAID